MEVHDLLVFFSVFLFTYIISQPWDSYAFWNIKKNHLKKMQWFVYILFIIFKNSFLINSYFFLINFKTVRLCIWNTGKETRYSKTSSIMCSCHGNNIQRPFFKKSKNKQINKYKSVEKNRWVQISLNKNVLIGHKCQKLKRPIFIIISHKYHK